MKSERISGVYAIVTPVGTYIGSSRHVASRFAGHRYGLRNGRHKNRNLQAAWDKYGEVEFQFLKVASAISDKDLLECEQDVINQTVDLLNIHISAKDATGVIRTLASREKMSLAGRGRKLSKKHKEAIAKGLTGRPVSDETKEKLAAQRGWKHSEEAKRKMRAAKASKRG